VLVPLVALKIFKGEVEAEFASQRDGGLLLGASEAAPQ
jgi:hypothetical protein